MSPNGSYEMTLVVGVTPGVTKTAVRSLDESEHSVLSQRTSVCWATRGYPVASRPGDEAGSAPDADDRAEIARRTGRKK